MPAIISDNRTHTVVVERVRSVGSVTARSSAVKLSPAVPAAAVATKETETLEVVARGPQGPKGDPGEGASQAELEDILGGSLDTNLLLIYTTARDS